MKYISIIMILSFSYYCVGCYSRTVLNNEEKFQDTLKKMDIFILRQEMGSHITMRQKHINLKMIRSMVKVKKSLVWK